jgi:predicted DNA-binding transcriptional regulator YafY
VLLGLRYVDQRGDAVLRAAAAVALAKIGAVLSPQAQAQAQITAPLSLPGPPSIFPQNGPPVDELRTAIRGQMRLDISYEDEQRQHTRRVVWPVQLAFMDKARVLAAWCELRRDFRTFRTDRITAMTPLDRYPGRRSELARRLRAHLEALANPELS